VSDHLPREVVEQVGLFAVADVIEIDEAAHNVVFETLLLMSAFERTNDLADLARQVLDQYLLRNRLQAKRREIERDPIVIYSMATSTAEDAPRGMEFLFSLNRLNVATSRARSMCILVASRRLFEPECRTPRQMPLANGFCRYLELAHTL